MNDILGSNLLWFFGVVEDRNDPLKLGRVRVRCYYWHTDDKGKLPTDGLPWAQVVTPITNPAMGDVGQSPTGLVEGTWVFGFFMDGQLGQKPMVLGSIPGIPFERGEPNVGFNDPNGVYPQRVGEPDVNRLARNQTDYPQSLSSTKDSSRTTGVATASVNSWDEPTSAYNAEYPKNHVYQSESGHIREIDDTPNNERIHEYHKSGTFFEIDKDGNKVTRVVGDNYEVVAGSDFINIKGDANLTVNGALNIKAESMNVDIAGNVTETIGGNQTTQISGNLDVDASRIDLN